MGNLEEWWDNKSLGEFQNKTQCFKEIYSKYNYEQEGVNVTVGVPVQLTFKVFQNFRRIFRKKLNM